MKEQLRFIEELRQTLIRSIGSKFQIRKKNAETMEGFVRGFADEHRDIVLISEQVDSMGMRIVELRNINEMQLIPVTR